MNLWRIFVFGLVVFGHSAACAQVFDTSFLSQPDDVKWDSSDYYWEPEIPEVIEYVSGEDSLAVLAEFEPYFNALRIQDSFLRLPYTGSQMPRLPGYRVSHREWGLLSILMISLFLLVILKAILPFTGAILRNPFAHLLKPPFDEKELNSTLLVASIFSSLGLAISFFIAGMPYFLGLEIGSGLTIGLILLLIFTFAILRIVLATAIGYLLRSNYLAVYANGFMYYEFLASLILLPIGAALLINGLFSLITLFSWIFMLVMLVLLIIRAYRAYLQWLSQSSYPFIEAILYFCALELVPFLLAVQFIKGQIS